MAAIEPLPAQRGNGPVCQPASEIARLKAIPEASGVAVSRKNPGLLWAIRDSGEPLLFGITDAGAPAAQVAVTGAEVDDWEDISVGACPGGSCVLIADIGDNNANRQRITIYRVREPATTEKATAPAEALHATYPDGPQDAEAFFVAGDRLFIVTKGNSGPIRLYRFPAGFTPGASVKLERVSELPLAADSERARVTDAEASVDGQWVAIRLADAVVFYRTADLTSATPRERFRADVKPLREPQGEGVAIGAEGTVYIVGEGPVASGGTFAKLRCALRDAK